MGMDLSPIAPESDYTLDGWIEPCAVSYNWNGWSWLQEHLDRWGVDLTEFKGFNDGDVISKETCVNVADAIESNLSEIDGKHKAWLQPHIRCWRECGGFEQW